MVPCGAVALCDGAVHSTCKAGSGYCVAVNRAKISTHSTTLLETRRETSVRGVWGAEILWQCTRGDLLSRLFLNIDFLRKIKLLTKLNITVIPSRKHLQLTDVFLLVKLNHSDCLKAIAVQYFIILQFDGVFSWTVSMSLGFLGNSSTKHGREEPAGADKYPTCG